MRFPATTREGRRQQHMPEVQHQRRAGTRRALEKSRTVFECILVTLGVPIATKIKGSMEPVTVKL